MSTEKSLLPELTIAKVAYSLVTVIAIFVIFIVAEAYIIPFVIALIVWFIIHELRENIQMVPFMKKHFPLWLQSIIAFIVICAVLVLVIELLLISMSQMTENLEEYQINFEIAMFKLSSMVGLDVMEQVQGLSSEIDFGGIFSSAADTVSSLFGDMFLILIYLLFLLIEEGIFHHKIVALYKSEEKVNRMTMLFQKMDKNISRYLSLKTLVSFLTGLLSYFVFLIIGLDGAIFWAMIIFVLNYIPTIGSLIATVFPAVFAILQFGEFAPFLYILAIVGLIQVVVGNIVEPKLMGNSLNISSLVVIVSLTLWGAIWGIMGAILSVPITVMIIVVCEEIPSLRFIAIMLSEKGNLNMLDSDDEELVSEVETASE